MSVIKSEVGGTLKRLDDMRLRITVELLWLLCCFLLRAKYSLSLRMWIKGDRYDMYNDNDDMWYVIEKKKIRRWREEDEEEYDICD